MTAPMLSLVDALDAELPGAVRRRAVDRLAYAHDASHYLLTPEAVLVPDRVEAVAAILRLATAYGAAVTFRSGGTSLSGQASGAGLLVDTRRGFRQIEVLDGGERVRVEPGATVRAVNLRLARYGRRLGPDPASEIACTIGGVVANNSSGMACGVTHNTYRTLESAVLVLPSGTVLDTARPDADEFLRVSEPALWKGLGELRDQVRADRTAADRIRRLFSIKNTMGYAINAFLDHERPVDLLLRLVVGSEGTLAFIAEATFRTVPVRPAASTALLVFPTLAAATAALPGLVATDPATIELLDATSLRVAQRDPLADARLLALNVLGHAALLIEYQESDATALEARLTKAGPRVASLGFAADEEFTTDAAARAALWHIRKGLYATIAESRAPGTTALLEDVAVPVERLLAACERLTALFAEFGYTDSVIFGHAKDGNIHFLLTERFDDGGEGRARYLAFTERLVELVLDLGGTLKAEHGTGRAMAPFVRRQYGDELYEVMVRVKSLCDPSGILNPGVLLSQDPLSHAEHLKSSPTVDAEVDGCVECGYCEPSCPSRDLTLTPRQRIVVRRELERARASGDGSLVRELERSYDYDGIDTCAADGMCQVACPVRIDTGALVKRLRSERPLGAVRAAWNAAAGAWTAATAIGGAAMTTAHALPAVLPRLATRVGRTLFGPEVVPQWDPELPAGGTPRRSREAASPVAVYFPACIGTMFGPEGGGTGVQASLLALCERAGLEIRVPEGVAGLCCGTPWSSKGHLDGYREMRERVAAELQVATDGGRLPVLSDATSCTEGLVRMLAETYPQFRVVDAVSFAADQLLPRLTEAAPVVARLAVHPTCSSTHLGVTDALLRIGQRVAHEVVVPDDWGCCGFAGDRGMLHPELTAAATSHEAAAVRAGRFDAFASLNRTCEVGMSRATGEAYRHILELLDEATVGVRPR